MLKSLQQIGLKKMFTIVPEYNFTVNLSFSMQPDENLETFFSAVLVKNLVVGF